MKGVSAYLVAAAVCALLGAGLLALGRLERDLARSQERFATMDYSDPEGTYDRAEQYFEYASHLPWVGSGAVNQVRAKKAALKYWQQQYGALVPRQPDPVGSIAGENVDLQLLVADAVYRSGQGQAKDRQSLLMALDAGINGYATVLKNAELREDAAYNYEYLIRLRDEVDKGRKKPGGEAVVRGPDGAAGAPPVIDSNLSDFKIYIPLESQERQDQGVAGKAAPLKRKG